ncbi:MAG: plasmid stabilization protein [Clostridiales bacterium]|jgi:hypothetical protein|nr:plasmid stabilization protein [Clostridiales bacterium]
MAERSYALRYLPIFEKDLAETVDYISYKLKNPIAANNFINDVEQSIMDRLKCPESFETYPSIKYRKYPYYRIYVKNFVIYYVVIDDESDDIKIMEIRRLLYNKRDRSKLI